MTSGFLLRAKVARNFGLAVMLAGLVPVLLFVIRSLLPTSGMPGFPANWLEAAETWLPLHQLAWIPHPVHAEIVFALAGLAVMWLGAAIVGRQAAVFEAERRRTEDRLRRLGQYGDGGAGRIEPFIGSPIPIHPDPEMR